MKIGIVGGTGDIGEGMVLRLSQRHSVIVGSREPEKAEEVCRTCEGLLDERGLTCSLAGEANQKAVQDGEVVILAIPFRFLAPTLQELQGFEGKTVISPVNPLQKSTFFYYAPPPEGSAAQLARRLLPADTKVVAAFNNIAANRWKDLDHPLEYSVAVCSDDGEAKKVVMDLTRTVPNLEPLDGGPLATASMVESITPLLLNLGKFNSMKDVGVRFR